MTRVLVIAGVIATTTAALADEGELQLRGTAAIEAALLKHPLSTDDAAALEFATPTLLPRAAIGASYGVTNELHLGLALDAALSPSVVTDDVAIGGVPARLLTGTYLELALPLVAEWRVDSGYDFTATVGLETGPLLALWLATVATDPTKKDAVGLPRPLPFDVADAVGFGAEARARVSFSARLFEALALDLGVYVGAAWATTASLHAGLSLRGAWIAAPP